MAKVLLFGTGSVGTVYACILSRGHAQVTCVCRSNYDVVRKEGLRVISPILGNMSAHLWVVKTVEDAILPQTNSSSTSTAQGPDAVYTAQSFDFVVVCTKSTEETTQAAIKAIAPAMTSRRTTLVIIQNGLGVERPFQLAYPRNTLLSGVAYLPTTQLPNGVCNHSEIERLHLGLYPSYPESSEDDKQKLNAFKSLIITGLGTVVLSQDIQADRWVKIIANGAINPICALSRCRDREFIAADQERGEKLTRDVMSEIAAVARAVGYHNEVNQSIVEQQVARIWGRSYPGVQPSMMADVLNTRSMEVEAIVGEVVRLADKHNVSVPLLSMLYVLLKGLDYASKKDVSS